MHDQMNAPHLLISTLIFLSLTYACKPAADTNQATDAIITDSTYYEQYRPQFHFSPPEKWMNDPNGMVYYEGEYHLFYQYNPDSTVWGPMHWGHAVSTDLVHWAHLPIALYPDSLGYIFSGSAVVDWNNTSGFGRDGQPPLIAIYTYHDPEGEKQSRIDYQHQAIAYSKDKGRTWTKYEKNPVIPNPGNLRDFRDPKVFWDEGSAQWVMTLAAYDHIRLYGSKDLKSWKHMSDWGLSYGEHDGVWECPDLFQLTVEGTNEKKWVLIQNLNPGAPNGGSGTQYFVGDFDGKKFTLDPAFEPLVKNGKALWLDYGRDNYAGVTWSDVPTSDGRRIFMGWMGNWQYAQQVPTEGWRSAMTLPCVLTLKNTANGHRLFMNPVSELNKLRTTTKLIQPTDIEGIVDMTKQISLSPSQMEIKVDFEWDRNTPADFGIQLSNSRGELYRIGYDTGAKNIYSDRTKAGDHSFSEKFAARIHTASYETNDGTISFRVLFDVASSELFADEGAFVMTDIFFPGEDFNQLGVFANKGKVKISGGEAHGIKRIW